VHNDDEVMLITTGGVLIRTRVSEIREMGRATQGVTLIALDDGTRLSGLQRVLERDSDVGNGSADGDNHAAAIEPSDGSTDSTRH
jgi:DNA gyrase subunit A